MNSLPIRFIFGSKRGIIMINIKKTPIKPLSSFFLGNRFWLFREANLEPGYPQELVDFGQDVPYDRIDTAIWWEPTGFTYLFQGDQ